MVPYTFFSSPRQVQCLPGIFVSRPSLSRFRVGEFTVFPSLERPCGGGKPYPGAASAHIPSCHSILKSSDAMKKESLKVLGIEVSRDFSVMELLKLSSEELMEPQVSYKVSVLREFCQEFCESSLDNPTTVQSSKDSVGVLAPHLKFLDHEECWVLLLNSANNVLSSIRISTGTVRTSPIDAARISKAAIIAGATGVILAHNHPSGSPSPSAADIKETTNLKSALDTFNISRVDHIILAEGRYCSFADEKESALGSCVSCVT